MGKRYYRQINKVKLRKTKRSLRDQIATLLKVVKKVVEEIPNYFYALIS